MQLNKNIQARFNPVIDHVKNTYNSVYATGAAVIVIHKDEIVAERYWGTQSSRPEAREVQEDTQFHVASVRKSYIGFAVAYAVHHGYIDSIDGEVTKYIADLEEEVFRGTTIRHLLTHTHGLTELEGKVIREFLPGESWAYRQVNINLLTQIVKVTTGQTVAELLKEKVFRPLSLNESDWYTEIQPKLAEVIDPSGQPKQIPTNSTKGDQINMFTSARDLAYWGYLHLKRGYIDNKQVIPKEVIQLSTSLISPSTIDKDLPQHGFLWFVKDLPASKTELGVLVPRGSYQILGFTGVAVLVIPEHEIVAVRMVNSYGSPENHDFLADIRSFGDSVMKSLQEG
ncbi:serine hydrolase domain-containing protein [Psychrobacillus sp. BL-248-WT-3]|uniref:serine hydrolase domain-containing protein n=1 Tax=Psychrobacillus sp. BL-248-WT-3 TaxID=2725306 RepID=UPI00146B26DA|nr:serine hydrolase domain-containing protein [Psychrobacillus sp. BL-248-WT-3]NME06020.1 beta-lactamase family protein [Psychrobacillus sp. BL-248-WT-3]